MRTLDRRAPFSHNGAVGVRGMRTQQRILDAALQAFEDHGYEATTVEQIAGLAGRSRVAVYQYFDDKNHIFRELTGQVSRQLWASLEALELVTPDLRGWESLRSWLVRHGDVHARYRAVYRDFGAAVASDPELAGGSARVWVRQRALFESRLTRPVLMPNRVTAAVGLLFTGLPRVLEIAAVLRAGLPEHFGRDRLDDALADVFHRSLFGPVGGVNVRHVETEAVPQLDPGRSVRAALEQAAALQVEAERPRRRALASMLAVGEEVITGRGYMGTRVEDVVRTAGVSRGAFYKYFDDRDEYVRVVAALALRKTSRAFGDVPDVALVDPEDRRTAQCEWLRSVEDAHGAQRMLVHARADGRAGGGAALEVSTLGMFDRGRRRMARSLRNRTIGGDVDAEAVVLLGLMEGYGASQRSPVEAAAMLDIIEIGLHGISPDTAVQTHAGGGSA